MTPSISEAAQVLVRAVAGLEQPRQRGDLAVGPLRDVERHHLVAERRCALGEHAVVVGARLVELGDHTARGNPTVGALAPQGAGPGVHPVVGRDHEEARSRRPRPARTVAHEVGVPGVSTRLTWSRGAHGAMARETERPCLLSGLVEVADGGAVEDGHGPGGWPPQMRASVSPKVVLAGASWPTRTTLRIRSGLLAPRSCPAGLRALPLSATANTSRSTSWSEATPVSRVRKGARDSP
jgi:hypothetical protein